MNNYTKEIVMASFALSGCKEIEGGEYPNACHISIAKRTKTSTTHIDFLVQIS